MIVTVDGRDLVGHVERHGRGEFDIAERDGRHPAPGQRARTGSALRRRLSRLLPGGERRAAGRSEDGRRLGFLRAGEPLEKSRRQARRRRAPGEPPALEASTAACAVTSSCISRRSSVAALTKSLHLVIDRDW